MSVRGRRRVLAAFTYAALVAPILAGLHIVGTTVRRVERHLLRTEAAVAAELVRETGDPQVLQSLFPDRWRISEEIDPTVDQAVVTWDHGGPQARAAIYDADSWSVVGTLHMERPAAGRPGSGLYLPIGTALAVLAAAALLIPVARAWTRAPVRRWLFPLGALLVITIPLASAGWSANARLAETTDARMQVAVQALEALPDRQTVVARPGGVYQLTGLPFMVRDADGNVVFSSLSSAATEDLAALPAPASGTSYADRVAYAVADVGQVRLALLPYAHTNAPTVPLVVLALIGVALAALFAALADLADRPRVFRRNVVAWSFLAPSFLHLVIFTIGPLLFAAWLSLHRWSLIDVARPFLGLANYVSILTDISWWNAIRNTAVFTLHVPASMALALALALIVQRRARGIVFLRALFFLPSITSLVAIAIAWQWMFHDEYGLLNWSLSLVGLGPVHWLTSTETALLAIMLMSVWLVVGYQMVLFQAGLAAIPRDLYDAARMDGAGPWRRFVHVTLPGLRHTLFFVLVTSVIGSFQIFGAVYVMTEGGPLHSTDVAVFHIYEEAWEFFRFGNAAAMSWILFAIIFVVTWLQFRTLERRTEEA
ncbi:MAG: ABC transporter permease subunit [Gemmatimonadales bacterium]|nr:ABC transporter permease subunit [Gemmatimonadales bacterium]NIN12558.1 ABC transporter permease subunit [Gemmatimonadales bacterium]NIR03553.1 ABC transporter permease subunit [Gemmatimonadales bacterium]NIS65875.1 ABC transporter permease subunit [Gemmatimonadales bacterium]